MAKILLILMLLAGATVANRGTQSPTTVSQHVVAGGGAPMCFPEPGGGCGQFNR